jgi:hypothetical protein
MIRRLSSGSWVRQAEHGILRVVSLVFSMASAYAIRLFFAPLDVADPGERYITWAVALGFGILGYVVSRGLVHRMMNKERIWVYVPICFLVELVDIACNYVLAASVMHQVWWLQAVPMDQRGILTLITYVVLSAIPLVSLFLAVVDMDLERSKQGRPALMPVMNANVPAVRPQPSAAAVNAATNSAAANSAAAKRAQFFTNRQGQQMGAGGVRTLMNDPEKDVTLVAVP